MRIYNRYLIFLVLVSCLLDSFLAFVQQNDIAVYFTANVIASLTLTVLFVFFNPKTRRALSLVSVVYLSGFLVIVTLKIVEVLRLK